MDSEYLQLSKKVELSTHGRKEVPKLLKEAGPILLKWL